MSSVLVLVNALVPIAFVILLGVLAGLTGIIKPKNNTVLAALALDFCVPSFLFIKTATLPISAFKDWRFFLAIALGLLVIYFVAFALSLTMFRKPMAASSLQALSSAFPNMSFLGIPVLTAVLGATAVLSVVVGNIISSFVLLPLTLTLLEAGKQDQGKGKSNKSSVVWKSVLDALKKPIVWAPLIGIVMVLAHIPMPQVVQKSFDLIGDATSGVALFAMGLLLSGQKIRIGIPAAVNVAFKNLVQPAVMWGAALLLGVAGLHRRELILLGALPTASVIAMFAIEYDVYKDESDASILISTVLSIPSLGLFLALTTALSH